MIGHSSRAAPDQLVGRATELGLLRSHLREAAHGSGEIVLVTGAPGVGKSALLEAAATWPGQVYAARTDEFTRRRPFGVLLDCLDGVVASSADHFATGAAIVDALAKRCAEGPVVLVLDDLHLADDETLALLHRLCNQMQSWPLLLLAAARSEDDGVGLERVLRQAVRQGVLTVLDLQPLDVEGANDLAKRVVGGPLVPDVARRLRAAGGNPLLLLTMLSSISRVPSDGDDELDAQSAQAVRRAAQVHELSPVARELVETGAVLGEVFAARDLGRTLDRPPAELIAGLREAIRAGILVEDAGSTRFRSQIVRDAVYAGLADAVRAELHRLAAVALDDGGAPAVVVAGHLLRAALTGADLDVVARVATRAQVEAPGTAAELWDHAAAVLDATDPRRASVHTEVALAWQAAGRPERAEPAARAALAGGASPAFVGALWRCRSTALLTLRRWDEAQQVADEAALADELTMAERAEQRAVGAIAATLAGDRGSATRSIQHADQLARLAHSPRARRTVNVAHGYRAYRRGQLAEAEQLLARGTIGPGPATECGVATYGLHAAVLSDLDRLTDARTVLDAAVEMAGARPTQASTVSGAEAALALDTGDLERAAAALDACLAPADDRLPHPSQVAQRAAVALHQQGPRAAERWLRRITTELDPFAPELGMVWLPRVGASIRIARGDLKGASEELWRGWVWRQQAEAVPDLLRIAPTVVEIGDRTGDAQRAVEAADVLDAAHRRTPDVPSIAAAAMFAHAVLARDVDGLVAAAALSLSSPRLLDAAELIVMIAGRLADLGEEELSASHTGRAIALYTSAGAVYDVQRLRSWLRSTGLHVPEARRDSGRDSLTRTESVVMSYLEEGRTNVEIAREMVISRRTVESHVSRILAKLGARSRAELIAARASELPGGRLAPGLDQLP